MINEQISLNVNGHNIILEKYLSDDISVKRDAVLIFPGGGYAEVCAAREGAPIALAYLEHGVNAFVLHYAVGSDYIYPSHLTDASCAIVYLKQHADELGIDEDRIFTVGFSAGGHLAGSLALLHDDEQVLSRLSIQKGDNKPHGAVLAYPVVSAMVKTHEPSIENLTGRKFSDLSEDERAFVSLEKHVNESSVPVFIWHTSRDTVVPMLGSLELAKAYYSESLPVALHIYPYGEHGVALANEVTYNGNPDYIQPLAEGWVSYSVEWMKRV